MIIRKEIIKIAEKKRLNENTIDKDWVLGHFLNAMFSFEEVKNKFVFKGGTALKKCYFEDYRFSEDLDFTLLDKDFVVDEKFIKKIIKRASEHSGIKFYLSKLKLQKSHEEEQGYEIKIKYWGANHKPNQRPVPASRWQTQIKLDISFSEKLFTEPEQKTIFHDYTDSELITEVIPVYSLIEVISEKLRSLIQRNRPRDIYDIAYLSKEFYKKSYPEIKKLLFLKAEDKDIDITGISDFVNDKKAFKNKRAWHRSLSDHLPAGDLPKFDETYETVKQFIEKILNSQTMQKLTSIDIFADFGMLKKPDTNEPVYLTFNMLHKPALLGILGAIIGESGFKEKGILPDYYLKLQDIKMGIQPLRHENGNYQKTIITYNNTTGMASKEQGGNLMVTEQTLIAPAYRCYFLFDMDNEIHQKADEYLSKYHAEYLPYLGKNEFSVWWENYTVYEGIKDFDFSKEYKVESIFYKNETVSEHIAKALGRAMRQELKDRFVYFERLPIAYHEIAKTHFQYDYADFVYTNARFTMDLKIDNIKVINTEALIQLF